MVDVVPAAFLSYVHADDEHEGGLISSLRELLQGEVRMQTGAPFVIFQDRDHIEWGEHWKARIDSSLDTVTWLIPCITPAFFQSVECRREVERFLERAAAGAKRPDLAAVLCNVRQDRGWFTASC